MKGLRALIAGTAAAAALTAGPAPAQDLNSVIGAVIGQAIAGQANNRPCRQENLTPPADWVPENDAYVEGVAGRYFDARASGDAEAVARVFQNAGGPNIKLVDGTVVRPHKFAAGPAAFGSAHREWLTFSGDGNWARGAWRTGATVHTFDFIRRTRGDKWKILRVLETPRGQAPMRQPPFCDARQQVALW